MSNAQRVQLGPFFDDGALQGGAKLYHYEAGLSTLKDIHEDLTELITLAQPFVADGDGIFNFFANGRYKLIICGPNSTGPAVDVLYTLDNWSFLDPTDPTLGEGTVIPSASTITIGPEVWAHISGSVDINLLSGTVPFFWAVFNGDLTLNYSANLLCPKSLNLAVHAGDVVFFLYEGGTVYRVAAHYQVDGLVIATQDTRTNTCDDALTVRSLTTGVPASGIATAILLQAESADETPCDVLRLEGRLSDVSAGSEDSALRVWIRSGGQAINLAWELLRGLSQFPGSFTHTNSANRTYTMQDASDTVVMRDTTDTLTNKTLASATNQVSSVALKTATGSASGAVTALSITMNDYAFFPAIWYSGAGAPADMTTEGFTADPANTVGRFFLRDATAGPATAIGARWRYMTASDNPVIWVSYDPGTGRALAVWTSDDPTPGDVPGVVVPGFPSMRLTSKDLERFTELDARAYEAQAYIEASQLRMENQAYRALQLVANDVAPSLWLLENCVFEDVKSGGLRTKTTEERAADVAAAEAAAEIRLPSKGDLHG